MELIKFAEDNYLKVFNLNISTVKKVSLSHYEFPDQIGQDRLANSLAVYLTPCFTMHSTGYRHSYHI